LSVSLRDLTLQGSGLKPLSTPRLETAAPGAASIAGAPALALPSAAAVPARPLPGSSAEPVSSPGRDAPKGSELERLEKTVEELSSEGADDQANLERLFSGSELRDGAVEEGVQGSESSGRSVGQLLRDTWARLTDSAGREQRRDTRQLFRRVRTARTDPRRGGREELLPYLDSLWEKGLLNEEEVRLLGKEFGAAALKATRRTDVFDLLAPSKGELKLFQQLASHPAASGKALETYASIDNPGIRARAAANPATPIGVLRQTAQDEDDEVRLAVARNPSAPADMVKALLEWDRVRVSLALLDNPGPPGEVLEELAVSEEPKERGIAASHPAAPPGLLWKLYEEDETMHGWLAGNKGAPSGLLREIHRRHGADMLILERIAGNPATPEDLLRGLARHKSYDVRGGVARNPSAPPDALMGLVSWRRLLFDRFDFFHVLRNLADNPSLPLGFAKKLLKQATFPYGIFGAITGTNPGWFLHSVLLRNAAFQDALGRPLWEYPPPALDDEGLGRLKKEVQEVSDYRRNLVRGLGQPGRQGGAAVAEASGRARPDSATFNTLRDERDAAGLPPFKNILIDVRGSRGGRGDVAAGYLMAMDMLEKARRAEGAAPDARVTFLLDKESRGILGGLMNLDIRPGEASEDGRIAFHTLDSLPRSFPVVDLYMAFASPSGTLYAEKDLRYPDRGLSGWLGKLRRKRGIPVDGGSVLLVQTVLGNTENPDSRNPYAMARLGGFTFNLLPAGLARKESGIYADQVAWRLRDKPREEVRGFILDELGRVRNARDREVVRGLLNGDLLAGSETGLVYGITHHAVKAQFKEYLRGLAAEAERSGRSYALVTPSGFSLDQLGDAEQDEFLRRVVVVGKEESPPGSPEDGKVYIVRTGGLPHPVFVGLMAYSRPPPVVAGDGAMSAAVILGRPFVMTRLPWNERNILNLKLRLLEWARKPGSRLLIEEVYGSKLALGRALELESVANRFHVLVYELPSLTRSVLDAASAVASLADLTTPLAALFPLLADDALRLDFMMQRAFLGDGPARGMFYEEYVEADAAVQRRVESLFVRRRSERGLRPFFLELPVRLERWLWGYGS
jgi:hypothetical protein